MSSALSSTERCAHFQICRQSKNLGPIIMDACTQSLCCQMKPKLSVKKENVTEGLLSSVKSLLQSRKELCTITDSDKTGDFIEVTFLGLSEESGAGNIQGVAAFHLDIPELVRSLHLCNLNENEVLLLKDVKETTKSNASQGLFLGAMCLMSTSSFSLFKSDALFVMLSKYTAGVKYAMEQEFLNRLNKKAEHHEDDDTNHSVSSFEDDFVTAFEHLDEEEPTNTNHSQGLGWETVKNQRDASSQTQPSHCVDISGSKIIFSSVRRRSSIKSAVLMGYLGLPEIASTVKNTVTTSMCNTWKQRNVSAHEKIVLSPSPVETSESECSSPSPIIFLDEEGYQKSLRAKLSLPKIPVGKDGIEDSDSELSEFFDSFDRFDEPETSPDAPNNQKAVFASPPKKRKCAKGSISTVCMNPQKFKFDCPALSACVKKPTPRKAESPFSNMSDVPDSPRPTKTCSEDNSTLFSPIRSSAFSPPGVPSTSECTSHLPIQGDFPPFADNFYDGLSDYANRVCNDMFDTVLNTNSLSKTVKKEQEKTPKLKRKSHGKEMERKSKSKHKSIKGGIQKFASDLVEKSLGGAFKDLQRGVSSCTSALCHLAARLTSYVFQMAFYEIGRRQAFSIKKRAINSLANLMVSEVITSALQELRYIKKQMVTNAVTRFAADLAEELVFEGIMEVCQFSHPPTPSVSYCQSFDYEDVVVSSYAKDLSESVIQEAFIELSQVNVGFTPEAAISVSVDNLKYVSSEGMMQSSPSSPVFPAPRTQEVSPIVQKSNRDFTVQYALFFTSGLVSSVPVPVAAKVLSQQPLSNDQTLCVESVKNYHISAKSISDMSSDKNIILGNSQEDGDGIKTFSVTMVDMIVNEAYDVIKSAKTVDDYAEMMTNKIIGMPIQVSLDGRASQNHEDSGKAIFKHSVGKSTQTASNLLEEIKSSILVDHNKNLTHETEMIYYTPKSSEQQKRIFRCPQAVEHATPTPSYFSVKPLEPDNKYPLSTCPGTSNASNNKTETTTSRRNAHSTDGSDPSLFSLHSCLPHINTFPSVMCSCRDDSFVEEKNPHKESVSRMPGTPPPTPLTSYDRSPERSMRKLNKRLKGQLAKEFYPATPPSTPHFSIHEQDNGKKDDFMLKLMRSLSEEVESSSSEESSEELEVSEETCRYADYLSSNIISVATDLAAYSIDDDSSQGATPRNLSQLSVLSDKWGYPAYMRNITEELLDTLCKYANSVAGEVISDAKETIGSRKNSLCDVDYCNSQTSGKDCRHKKSKFFNVDMSYKASDPTTLSLPHNNCGTGLTSKYPSCESVTEEYADHLIRVLKMEGGNSELILDQYASRLVYRAMKSGLQQASKNIKVKCNRKIVSKVKSEASTSKDIFRLLNRSHHSEKDKRRQSNVTLHSFTEDSVQKPEFTALLHLAESLSQTITCDVRRKLKMSSATLPKSLTDSCLYSKSKNDYITGDLVKSSFPKSLLPLPYHKQKLYHSTSSLNDHGLNDGILKAIEQYACKVVDRTLEVSMEAAKLQAMENKKKTDKVHHAGKLIHSYGTACRLCSAIDQLGSSVSSCHFLLGHDSSRKGKLCSKSRQNSCQKSRFFHLNIPKIHIDLDKRSVFADKIVSAALEKAERELSNASLGVDSGVGHNGISFAESLTAEIMMSAMKNIGHVSISSIGKDGFQSVDSATSQHTSVSVGDDSTGSWSNLSFEDEHQDECSSFLHLSDSNGNSSSWSSLGLEGDMCEENLSFPPSDSDGTEEKDEDPKITAEVVNQQLKTLHIRNVDIGPSSVESQLRMILQWIAASESGISEIHFLDQAKQEILPLFRRVREKGWKIGDLLQAVLLYCENLAISSDIPCPLYGWLLEYC
ncbi:A-kinase anchor protein 11 isoform X1 [Hyla sarda]|uniref:A-kinase anchor protein 11 isoform X1 n=1 Tax=Hyla sarda TaxID=327740 RepID=UPI0024C3A08C|nr:A-kinase anchor protein 11 isoform X1 [Hyla sarda]